MMAAYTYYDERKIKKWANGTSMEGIHHVSYLEECFEHYPKYKDSVLNNIFTKKIFYFIHHVDSLIEFQSKFPTYFDQMMQIVLEKNLPLIHHDQDFEKFCKHFPNYKKSAFDSLLSPEMFQRMFTFRTGELATDWVETFYKKFPELKQEIYHYGIKLGFTKMPKPTFVNPDQKLESNSSSTVVIASKLVAPSADPATVLTSVSDKKMQPHNDIQLEKTEEAVAPSAKSAQPAPIATICVNEDSDEEYVVVSPKSRV